MTREEAISWLKEFKWHEGEDVPIYETDIEAIEMAIKALEQEPTTKNDLAGDCISRKAVLKIYDEWFATCNIADKKESPKAKIKALPSVTPQEPKTAVALARYKDLQDYFSDKEIAKTVLNNQTEFKKWLERLRWNTKKVDELARKLEKLEQEPPSFQWCTDCKEYDQEKHCCHRWSKVIRDTVEEMKQEQEPILDKIRAELHATAEMHEDGDYYLRDEWIDEYFDKYKAESEG